MNRDTGEIETAVQSEPVPPTSPYTNTETTTPPSATETTQPATAIGAKNILSLHPGLVAVLGIIFLLGGYGLLNRGSNDSPTHPPQFTKVYSFVPEKISKSADIVISLPPGLDETKAREAISFFPEVRGEWLTEEIPDTLIYSPQADLTENIYYAVSLNLPETQLSGDFLVDKNPAVVAAFPQAGSIAPETSDITIVFSRPIVPLTTLNESESVILPITIEPQTAGRFKWISSRTLQFIPETTLRPSSEYTVILKEGLTAPDGVAVPSFTHTFTTRPLSYAHLTQGPLGYRTPFAIAFNQPVDLNKTRANIRVTNSEGKTIPIDITHGERTWRDWETGTTRTEKSLDTIFVYQKKDRHGRERLWDFDTTYTLTITGAETETGTLPLTETRSITATTPNIVASVEATSPRTDHARPDLFDPQGTLVVHFYDEIDIDRLDVNVKGFRSVVYGEHCSATLPDEEHKDQSDCKREPNKRVAIFSFNETAFATNESFTLSLKRVYTTDGQKINARDYDIPVRTYPAFIVYRTNPEQNAAGAALTKLSMCSNVPLRNPTEDESLATYLKTTGYIVYGRWSGSQYIPQGSSWNDSPCKNGEFITEFPYGLLPNTSYTMKLDLTDAFGQTVNLDRSFTTTAPAETYTRFHNLQQQYNVTRPGKTNLTYAVENLESVDLHICKMAPETFLERSTQSYSLAEAPRDSECMSVIRETIPLPHRYWVNNYFQINLADYFSEVRGQYVVTFSSPLYVTEKTEYNRQAGGYTTIKQPAYDRTFVSVTNLAVGKKEVENFDTPYNWSRSDNPEHEAVLDKNLASATNLYWVSESTTLTPVTGAVITQYRGSQYNRDQPLRVGSTGITRGDGTANLKADNEVAGAIIRSGADVAVVADWADTLEYAQRAEDASRTYLYTDRPIYRPGHTVYLRGIDRIGFDGNYEITPDTPVPLSVRDSRDAVIYETNLSLSRYGTFHSSFEIPSDAPLGTYRIEAFGQATYFSVEEYVPAAFKLETQSENDEYISGDTLTVGVQADYYFGVPLDGGTVAYTITAQDYHFDRYTDEYFNFGSGWYYCYDCSYGDRYLTRGETRLNQDGHATIVKPFTLSDYFDKDDQGSKLVTISITVTDQNGRAISTQRSFVVHRGSYYIGSRTDNYYVSAGTPVTLRAKTVDVQGVPVAKKNLERIVEKIEWETFKRQEVDGGFYYRSTEKRIEVERKSFATSNQGDWSESLTLRESGEYQITIRGTDEQGNTIETKSRLYVFGGEAVYQPPNNNYSLAIETERNSYEVGDTASILIKSPYQNAKALIAVERGVLYDYWIVDVIGGLAQHTFPITQRFAPNIRVSALLLSSDPEIKFGSVAFDVGNKEQRLTVAITSNKAEYLPGEVVNLTVRTTNSDGQPVPAEVSLAVADLSVLALRGNPKKDPLQFFYDGFPLSVTTASNIKNILYEAEIPLGTKGGGGGSPDDLATKQRGLFKDTAFWTANLETGAQGEASARFTLPDNLTTWQVEAIGVTEDTKLGADYAELTTNKPVMITPLKPRFIVPGDSFAIGAQIFNQSKSNTRFTVTIDTDSLETTGDTSTSFSLNAGESKTTFFPVQAPKSMRKGSHTFTLTTRSEAGEDSVIQNIPITPSTVFETVATANATTDTLSTEYLFIPPNVVSDEGGLTINTNATLAVFMSDALTYMATYPYGCSEQIASALSSIAMISQALTVPNVTGSAPTILDENGTPRTVEAVVTAGLARMYETQDLEGGIAYYKGLAPNLHLTLRVVEALGALKAAGFEVNEQVLSRALTYIETKTAAAYARQPEFNHDAVIAAEYILKTVGGKSNSALTPIIQSVVNSKLLLNQILSSESLAYLSMITSTGYDNAVSKRVYETLLNRINIDGRGAYLSNPATAFRSYYETPVGNTALLLKTFTAKRDKHEVVPNVLRWLLANRDRDGVWGSTQNTYRVVTALVEYLRWKRETEADFTVRVAMQESEILNHHFNPTNIFLSASRTIPMADLKKGDLMALSFEKSNEKAAGSNLYYDLALRYYVPAVSIPPRDEGITITRDLFSLVNETQSSPITTAGVGEIVRGRLTLTIPDYYRDVAIEDIVPAGFEIVNFNLATEDQSLREEESYYQDEYGPRGEAPRENSNLFARAADRVRSLLSSTQGAQSYSWKSSSAASGPSMKRLRPTHSETHDDRVFLFVDTLIPGVYTYEYFLRALVPGEFQHLPAGAYQLYFPEIFGRTQGGTFTITPQD